MAKSLIKYRVPACGAWMTMLVVVWAMLGCNASNDVGAPSDSDSATAEDTETTTASETETASDIDTETDSEVPAVTWYDSATGLLWENPPSGELMDWTGAADYCDELSLGGYDDWRLPRIHELISLLRGCVDGLVTGDLSTSECSLSDPDCLTYECWQMGCAFCDEIAGGPDNDPIGCFWAPELNGDCQAFWSSSIAPDAAANSVWGVSFVYGALFSDNIYMEQYYSWCVRDAS